MDQAAKKQAAGTARVKEARDLAGSQPHVSGWSRAEAMKFSALSARRGIVATRVTFLYSARGSAWRLHNS